MAAVSPAFAQGADGSPAQTVITVLGKNNEAAAPVQERDLKVQVGGKSANITDLVPLRGDRAGLELVILIDGSARTSLGTPDGRHRALREVAAAHNRGRYRLHAERCAVFSQPFTTDKAKALKACTCPMDRRAAAPALISASRIWPRNGPPPIARTGARWS